MGFIGIDKILFASAMFKMNRSANGINVSNENWESMGEVSKVFDAYVTEFMQLQMIMKDYQALILKDLASIQAIGDDIVDMDLKLLNLWK